MLSQDELCKALNTNNLAIERLVNMGKIPYKRIVSINGDIIQFCPNAISRWMKKGIDLSIDDKKFLERYTKNLKENAPESLKKLKEFSDQFLEPTEPKRFYLERVPNKKLGFVLYVKYLKDGRLIHTRWCTHTNNYELAEKFAIENRERLIAEYYERKADRKPYFELYSILKKYYVKDSAYLQVDAKRGRNLGEGSRATYNNFINKQFIPYLKKHGIKDANQIDTPFLTRFQNYLLADKKKNGKFIKGLKPQTINHYISYISQIFDHLLLEGFLKTNPCNNVVSIKIGKDDQKITGCYEINKLKSVFNKKWKNELSYLLTLLMYTTNMRNSEIERIQLNDIILIDKYHYININESKSVNGIRIVPLHNFVYRKLLVYARKNNKKGSDYLFKLDQRKRLGSDTYKKAYLELAAYTGYSYEQLEAENIKFYSGRHFWKTLMNSESLGDVEEYFMGHKVSADVAKRYNHRDKQGKEKLLEKTKKVFDVLDKKVFK